MKTKTLLLGLLALALALPSFGQTTNAPTQKDGLLAHLYDVDSATLTYCAVTGANGDVFGAPFLGPAAIKTTGTTTTVVEFTTGTNPFTKLSVGDTIVVTDNSALPTTQSVVVVAKASAASITVSSALTLTAGGGHNFNWLKQTCGTGLTSGWFGTFDAQRVGLTVQYEQGDLDALTVRFECKDAAIGAAPVVIYPGDGSGCGGGTLGTGVCEFATPGITSRLSVVDDAPVYGYCRVGLAYKTTDTSDAGAAIEQVTVAVYKK